MIDKSKLKYLGIISYYDLFDVNLEQKYADGTVLTVVDIPDDPTMKCEFERGVYITKTNNTIAKLNGHFQLFSGSSLPYVKFVVQIEDNEFNISGNSYSRDEIAGIAKFFHSLPDCIDIKGYINTELIMDANRPEIFTEWYLKPYLN